MKEALGDTLYHYRNGGLEPVAVLALGKYSAPAEAFGMSPTVKFSDLDSYSVQNILEGKMFLFVAVKGHKDEVDVWLVFDRQNPSKGFTALGTDGNPGLYVDGIAFTPVYVRDNRLVGYVQALDIVDNAESITNPDLKALAATLREDSNPVIVAAGL